MYYIDFNSPLKFSNFFTHLVFVSFVASCKYCLSQWKHGVKLPPDYSPHDFLGLNTVGCGYANGRELLGYYTMVLIFSILVCQRTITLTTHYLFCWEWPIFSGSDIALALCDCTHCDGSMHGMVSCRGRKAWAKECRGVAEERKQTSLSHERGGILTNDIHILCQHKLLRVCCFYWNDPQTFLNHHEK